MGKGKKLREYKAKVQVKLAMPIMLKMAREMEREDFLNELKMQWTPFVTKHSTLDSEMKEVDKRIKMSGLKKVFEVAKVTDLDIRQILRGIRKEKFGESELG